MTKQEEIREGVAIDLAGIEGHDWSDLDKYKRSAYLHNAQYIVAHLHSQGVVIKVKCPDCTWSQLGEEEYIAMIPCYSCNSTGYIVEPLIKEVDAIK